MKLYTREKKYIKNNSIFLNYIQWNLSYTTTPSATKKRSYTAGDRESQLPPYYISEFRAWKNGLKWQVVAK